jgi:glycerate dehydrogenase
MICKTLVLNKKRTIFRRYFFGFMRNSIVVLDGYTLNPGDLRWDDLKTLGDLIIYGRTMPEQVIERAQNADIVLVNKVVLDEPILARLPRLRCICVLATGYNNIDAAACRARDIRVCNAPGYGPDSVAQHVFALLLEMTNAVGHYSVDVAQGGWRRSPDWCYGHAAMPGLSDMTLGLYGWGDIGRRVGAIGRAFGMKLLVHTRTPGPDAYFVDWPTLLRESDVISLHAPLTAENKQLINCSALAQMKPDARLINTARGGLVDEAALAEALRNGHLAGAALDVLSAEPPGEDNPLIGAPRCIVTPHQAWAARNARARLMAMTAENVQAFLNGSPVNVVV